MYIHGKWKIKSNRWWLYLFWNWERNLKCSYLGHLKTWVALKKGIRYRQLPVTMLLMICIPAILCIFISWILNSGIYSFCKIGSSFPHFYFKYDYNVYFCFYLCLLQKNMLRYSLHQVTWYAVTIKNITNHFKRWQYGLVYCN